MQEKTKARLRELTPAARWSQEAGSTQPSLHLFLHACLTPHVTDPSPLFCTCEINKGENTGRASDRGATGAQKLGWRLLDRIGVHSV